MVNTSTTVALPIITVFWLLFGAGLPWLVPKGPNRGTIRIMIVTTAVCCYLFWLIAFLTQLQPLIGPEISNSVVGHMRRIWLGYNGNVTTHPCFPHW